MATRKNPEIVWPEGHFTINTVQTSLPDMVNITLRFRIKRAIEKKEIVVIGKIKPAIGRPMLVFSKVNPTAELLEAATKAGVLPMEEEPIKVTVANINASNVADVKTVQTKSVVTTKA